MQSTIHKNNKNTRTLILYAFVLLLCIDLAQTGCSSVINNFFSYLVNEDIVIDENDNINNLLDKFTDSKEVSGNDVQLLINGPESYEVFVNLIKSAKNNINIETLNFDDDSNQPENISLEFADMLIEKAGQGVRVNLILDKLSQEIFGTPSLVDKLIKGNVNVKYYHPPADVKTKFPKLFYHTHKKLLIIDGQQAIVGGMNFGYKYFGTNQWRDTNVLLTGPIVASLQSQFLRDWQMLGGQVPEKDIYFPELKETGDVSARAIDQRPGENDFDINNAVLIALRFAKYRIDIEAPYFNPSNWLADEIKNARKRGIEIRILTNSKESVDIPQSFTVSAYNFDKMLELGIRVFLWTAQNRTMHSKIIVVDNAFAMIGSYNFNRRSIMWDAEDAVIFTDAKIIEMFNDMLEEDFNSEFALEITPDWISSQDKQEQESWQDWQILNWLF